MNLGPAAGGETARSCGSESRQCKHPHGKNERTMMMTARGVGANRCIKEEVVDMDVDVDVDVEVDVLMVVNVLKLHEYSEERGDLPSPRDQILMV